MIYIIKQEGLYQKKVNSSLVFTRNYKIGYSREFFKIINPTADWSHYHEGKTMGKECWTWVSRSLWKGGNTTPLRLFAWEARTRSANK